MQEEVENRTVNLVVSTTRLSARVLIHALQRYLARIDRRRQARKSEKRQIRLSRKMNGPRGRQTVKQLMRQGTEIKRLPVQTEHLREFEKVVKKYGVDFAVTKGMYEGRMRYLVFFKAKDEAVLSDVYQECIARQLHKKDPERKPSILKALAQFKVLAGKTPMRAKQKELSR